VSVTLELFDGAFWRDPYPAYAQLRDDAPVRRLERADGVVWMVSRFSDVKAALVDPRLSKDWRYTLPPAERAAQPATPIPMMILMDPPGHTRLRKLVSRVFTLRRMEALRPRVEQVAAELIAALPAAGRVDLMPSYAFLLPVLVICELLGVPASDRDEFAAWSNTMVDDQTQDRSMEAAANLHGYLSQLIEAKRARPDDALISALIEDADDDRLTPDELVAMAMMLLIAGHETTVNLIGNGMLALLTHPEQLELLRCRPELLPAAVEEFLRWDSPVHSTPARFAEPGELRIERADAGHTAFGHGLHHCLGAQLARIEGQEAIGALLAARAGITLAVDPAELVYRRSTLVRGLRTLPVDLAPVRG
jgi:vitamin D3 1,25-hydroxylase